jgi:hypothetical protein
MFFHSYICGTQKVIKAEEIISQARTISKTKQSVLPKLATLLKVLFWIAPQNDEKGRY